MKAARFILHDLGVYLIDLTDKRRRQQLAWGAAAHKPPILDGVDCIAVHGSDVQVMDGGDHRPVQPPHQVHQLELVFDVQMVGGLIQDEAGGLLGQGPGQDDPLLLPAGEGGEGAVRKVRHPHSLQGLGHNLVILGAVPVQRPLVRGPAHEHHIPDGEIKIVVVVLGHHRQTAGGFPAAVTLQGPAIQIYRAAGWLQHPVDAFEQSGFPAAVGADHPHQLPRPGLHVHPMEDVVPTEDGLYSPRFYLHQSPPPKPYFFRAIR